MSQRRWARPTFTVVVSLLALVLSLTGGVFASHLQVLSSDIVDGEVKTADIASGAVTTAKLSANAVTGAKTKDGSLTGADIQDNSLKSEDIDEASLTNVNATTLNGLDYQSMFLLDTALEQRNYDMPDCNPGLAYLTKTFTAPGNGYVAVQGSFTAAWGTTPRTAPGAIAARIERSNVSGTSVGAWQEDHLPANSPGRANIALADMFRVVSGENTFVLKTCDSYDDINQGSGLTIRGSLNLIFQADPQS